MPSGTIPSWLQPADPARNFLQAYQAGAQIQQANRRLQQSQQEMDQQYAAQQQKQDLDQKKLAAEQEREKNQALQEQQQLEVTKSYHDQQIGMQQDRLKQAKAASDARIQQAAQRYGQQMQIQQRAAGIHAAVDAGTMTQEEGDNQIARLAVETSMGTPQAPAALRAAQSAEPAQAPKMGQSPEGQEYFYGKNFRLGQRQKQAPDVKQYSPAQANQLLNNPPAWLTDADKATLTKIAKTGLTGSTGTLQDAYAARMKAKTATGTTPGAAPQRAGKVRVKDPNGKIGWIPEKQLPQALKAGYERADTAQQPAAAAQPSTSHDEE